MTQTAEHSETGRRADRTGQPERKGAGEGGRRRGGAEGRDRPPGRPKAAAADGARARDGVVVAGEPRVHLLPPEVVADRKAAVLRGRLGLGVLAALAVAVLGVLGASSLAASAQSALASDQATTQSLLKQQLSYVKVRAVQDHVDLIKVAQQVGDSTEIRWTPYLQQVQATLPANVTIIGVAVDSATPIALYQQSTASLQGPRVATIVFTAESPSLPEVPSWLIALKGLPGYADALPGSVKLDQNGVYTATITMHVNEKAFSNRFSPKAGK